MYLLLYDFNPEVKFSSFNSLSLPFESQLGRLLVAKAYLQCHRRDARADALSLYCDFGFLSSFAVRFSDGSLEYYRLLSDIKQQATVAR